MNVIINQDRTRKCVVSDTYDEWSLNNSQADQINDIFIENAPAIPEGMHTPQLSIDNSIWIEVNTVAALEMQKEKDRVQLKLNRENALKNIIHDFGDGRIVQVRPEDVANFQIAINLGLNQEWVMSDNTISSLTPAELQQALDSGISQGKQIWQTYIDSIKLL